MMNLIIANSYGDIQKYGDGVLTLPVRHAQHSYLNNKNYFITYRTVTELIQFTLLLFILSKRLPNKIQYGRRVRTSAIG